jgi:hypothetical protein
VKAPILFLLFSLCGACTGRQHGFQAALDEVSERCGLGPWRLRAERLRAGSEMLATFEMRPNARALPITERQFDCVNTELKKIPARLVALD